MKEIPSFASGYTLHRFGLETPTFMMCVLGLYLYFIYDVGPNFMKHRKPYQLKKFIIFYNIAQVLACIFLLVKCISLTGWIIFKFWKCKMPLYEDDGMNTYDNIVYFTFWLKLVELTETIVFVLRKKQNQVSYLHVFHHCSTVTLIFLMGNNYRGLGALFPLILNCTVHVLMYTYYLTAALCDKKTLQSLTPVKKSITISQMVQFVFILTQAAIHFVHCSIPRVLAAYYCVVVAVIFYGFYDFYKKAYNANTARQKESQIKS